jgi:predicted nucleic acid-binding protein
LGDNKYSQGGSEAKSIVDRPAKEGFCTTTITRFELFSKVYHRGLVKEGRVLRRLVKGLNLLTFDENSRRRLLKSWDAP